LINNFDYSSDRILSNKGLVSSFDFLFKNVSKKGKNSSKYKDNFTNKNFLLTNYTLSFPLKKEKNDFSSNLSPKLSLRYSPFDTENLINTDRKINSTNIFSINRLGISDSLEGGQSVTLGFDYDLFKKDDSRILSSSLGQIFKDKNDHKLPITSTMQNKSSDIVGQIIFTPNDKIGINYNYSADNNLDTMNYNFLETELKINNFVASFDFLEENNEIGSDSYFSRDIGYKLDQNNMISYATRRNRKTDLTEYYNLIYQYKNDCLVAAIEYNKNYYEDRDIRPNEEIFFSLTITPFTSVNSPNINK
jgi:LPS-assembly protein